jgi:hypothetical protein
LVKKRQRMMAFNFKESSIFSSLPAQEAPTQLRWPKTFLTLITKSINC